MASMRYHHFLSIVLWALLLLGVLGCEAKEEPRETSPTMQQRRNVDPRAASFLQNVRRALQQNDLERALALTDSAARYAPELADIYFLRGYLFTQMGRLEQAGTAYEKVVSLDEHYPAAWYKLGNNAFRREQYAKALRYYRNDRELLREQGASDQQRSVPMVILQMGRAYNRLGKADSAQLMYQQAIDRDPTFAKAYGDLAHLAKEEGDFEQALTYARQALQYDSANVDYQYVMGLMLLRNGRPKKAVETLQGVIEKRPWHHSAHYNLGQALVRLGRREEGQRFLSRADTLQTLRHRIAQARTSLRLKADRPKPWIELGDLQRQAKRFPDAARSYHQALRLGAKDSTDVWTRLAKTYDAAGRPRAARQAWQNVLESDPDHAAASAALAGQH